MKQPTSFLTTRALCLDIASTRLVALALRYRAELMRTMGSKSEARTLEAAAAILDDACDDATRLVDEHGPALADCLGDIQRIEASISRPASPPSPDSAPPTTRTTKPRTSSGKVRQP